MPFDGQPIGIGQGPRPGEPESNLLAGMAAARPADSAGSETLPLGPGKGPQGAFAGPGVVAPLAMPDTSQPGPVALQQPASWAYDFSPANGVSRATFNGEIDFASIGPSSPLVASFNTRSGIVTLTQADVSAVAVGSFNTRVGAVVLTLADVTATGIVPPGTVWSYAGTVAPAGWLLCDGSAVSRTGATAALFAAIQTTYGVGDGSTTFNLPDCRGRSTIGLDPGGTAGRVTTAISGIAGQTLGAVGGDQNMMAHNHSVPVGGLSANGVNVRAMSGDGTNAGYFSDVAAGAGNSQNMPPSIVMQKIIKT